jgi:hypothetical protein
MEESISTWQGSLSDSEINEFRKIWRKEFEEKLSRDDARTHAQRLLELYTLLYTPTPHEVGWGINSDHVLTDAQLRALLFIGYTLADDRHSQPFVKLLTPSAVNRLVPPCVSE